MMPYVVSNRKDNIVECNADFAVVHNNRLVMLSLVDLSIKVKKVFADIIQGNSEITLYNREDMLFEKSLNNWNENFQYKLSKHNEKTTHGIILNKDKESYIFDWEGKGIIKSFTLFLRNKHYIPVTEEIVKKVLDSVERKTFLNVSNLIEECEVYTNKKDMKHVKVWYVHNTELFKELLEDIELTNNKQDNFNWDEIENISDYLTKFANSIKEKLKNKIVVLYDNNMINKKIYEKKKPYKGQIPIIQGGIETLKRKDNRFLYIAGEPGVGKTLISTKINQIYHSEKEKKNFCTLVIAPTQTLTQWKDEIQDSIKDDVEIIIIKNTKQFINLYEKTKFKMSKPTYILVGKETFKLSYKIKPAIKVVERVVKIEKDNGFWDEVVDEKMEVCICPDCFTPLTNPLRKSKYVYLKKEDFNRPKKSNYRCSECKSVLWQATYDKNSKTSVIDYIKRKNIKFDSLILDEAHESNNFDSIIGAATREILQRAKKSILLSGTITNGYASSIYNILFALIPNTLKRDNVFEKENFVKTYGTLMAVTKNKDNEYYITSRTQVKDSDFQEVEGINPLVFTKYFSNNFIFVELSDIKEDVPNLNEHFVGVNQLEEVEKAEKLLYKDIEKVSPFNSSFYKESVIKHFANKPYNWNEIEFEYYKEGTKLTEYVQPTNIDLKDTILPKDKKLIEICKERVAKGEKVWIYNDFITNGKYTTGESVEERIARVLNDAGLKVYVLKSSVRTIERREIVNINRNKYDVFISNAKLVGTGINMQWCTNYIFYSPTYHVNTVRQASRRGLRANSTVPSNIYHLYFKQGIEEEIIERYKLKLAESEAVQAKFVDIGVKRTASSLGAKIRKELANNF